MAEWHRVQGDVKDTIVVHLGGIANLNTASSVVAIASKPGEVDVSLDGSVSNAANAEVTISLAVWLEDAALGDWSIVYVVTFGDGSTKTWPELHPDRIHVRAR